MSSRSLNFKKQVVLGYVYKIIYFTINYIIVPIQIAYLGKEKNGVWVTIVSIISWISMTDLGIGNGLRNTLTVSISNDDKVNSKQLVSTAYYAISRLMMAVWVILLGINIFFSISQQYILESKISIAIAVTTICGYLILNVINSIAYSLQKASLVGLSTAVNNLLTLILLIICNYIFKSNLIIMSLIYCISHLVSVLLTSFAVYKNNDYLIPSKKYINKSFINEIINIGGKFFVIQIFGVVLFSTDNIIINIFFGGDQVTDYNIIYKLFNMVNVFFSIILSALWSSVTDAYARNDIHWIKKTKNKLLIILIPISLGVTLLAMFIKPIVHLWIGDTINIDYSLVIISAIYTLLVAWNGIYVNIINGIGKINLQMWLMVIAGILNIPLSIFLSKSVGLGIAGVKLGTLICILPFIIAIPIQCSRILNNSVMAKKGSYSEKT